MCGAVMGAVSAGVGIGGGMSSSGGQALSQRYADKYAMQTEKVKARIANKNAGASYQSGLLQVDKGSTDAAAMWKDDQNAQLGRDLNIIMRNAQSEAWNYSNQAKMHKAQARVHKSNIKNADRRAAVTLVTAM